MANMVGIKYIESLYIVQKKKKYNITAIAITTDEKKIASSIFATPADITKIYNAYSINKENKEINTTISSGIFALNKYIIPTEEFGIVPMYSLHIGNFKCKMPPSAFDQFVITLESAHKNMQKNNGIIIPFRRKRKKGIFG